MTVLQLATIYSFQPNKINVLGIKQYTTFKHNAAAKLQLRHFNPQVDHFGFANTDTYQMRYLYNMDYWDKNGGTILFYCGNEGDIEDFAINTVS